MAGHWAVESARPVNPGGPSGSPKPKAISARNCKFESISLQRRVYCELDFRGQLVCEAIDLPKVLKTITFSPARVRPETVRCAKIGLELQISFIDDSGGAL
jgi:hypothetical protein